MASGKPVLNEQDGNKPEKPKKQWIGQEKPKIEFSVEPEDWPGKLYPAWKLEIEDGDHLRIDEQGYE